MTTLGELAQLVNGQLQGDEQLPISGAAALADAAEGQITLIDSPRRLQALEQSPAAAVVAPLKMGPPAACPTILVDDVHAAFSRIVRHFRGLPLREFHGIHPAAHISPTARIAKDVTIHAGACVGEEAEIGCGTVIYGGAQIGPQAVLGDNVVIHPAVVLYERTRIGNRVTIHGNAVIGAPGFGYDQNNGRHVPTAQLGWVEIGDDVEIGASTTIDRGTYGPTLIGEGTKIDNLVQIAHNCRIGRHNLICSQVGIAGSTTTGDHVVMAGQVGIRDHVHIGKGAVLSAMAGITSDVPEGAVMMGIPATPEREQKLKLAALAKLVEMRKEFKEVKRALASLATQISDMAEDSAADLPRIENDAA